MPHMRLERLNEKSSGEGRNPLPKKGEKKMAEVNFAKVFETLSKNRCEDCGRLGAEWIGNADGGQNLCEVCANIEEYGEPVYACRHCGHPAWTAKGNCTNAFCL